MLFQFLLIYTLFGLSHSLPATVRAVGEWESCSGQQGVCVDVNSYTCTSDTVTGQCPGASNIRCCPYPGGVFSTACDRSPGVCTRTENCQGTTQTGLCPGPSGITCCNPLSGCTLGTTLQCSTDVASGITQQLLDELTDMGIIFDRLSDTSKFRCTAPCQPYLQRAAKKALSDATSAANDFITLTSAYRSSAQQYLLYVQNQQNRCGISAAARPGTSLHEAGLAIDTGSPDYWRPRLEPYGWVWFGPGDRVHFSYTTGGDVNVRRESLRAFQRLWNRNNPADQISEDGVFGPNTEQRLKSAPCAGW